MKIAVLVGGVFLVSVAMANPVHNQIADASEAGRLKFFANVLNASGDNCPSANRTFYQGADKTGAAYWNIQCTNGKAYQMQIANNATGSSRSLDCELIQKMNAGTCFKPFK
jgi:hypothetical protein